jgi:hypothetical protein
VRWITRRRWSSTTSNVLAHTPDQEIYDMLRRMALLIFVPLVLLLSGCSANGGGWVPSTNGVDKATFGFTFDGTTSTFSGSFRDKHGSTSSGVVDVNFKGTGKLKECSSDSRCNQGAQSGKGGCLAGEVTYRSQNSKFPGQGLVFLYVCDTNRDKKAGAMDTIFVQVDSGPYMGYTNSGNTHGSITVKN